MKIQNTTDFSETFLRRMIAWCRKESEIPAKAIRLATFRNARRSQHRRSGFVSYSGWADGGRQTGKIRVSIGPDFAFPTKDFTAFGVLHPGYNNRVEALVAITAHELQHLAQFRRGLVSGNLEPECVWAETRVLKAFRANCLQLFAQWNETPDVKAKPAASIVEKRAAKAAAALAQWQRKLKLAQTKVRKYKQRVGYYERRQAATKGTKP